MKQHHILALIMSSIILYSCNNKMKSVVINDNPLEANILVNEQFNSNLSHWIIEQREGGTVQIIDGKMNIDDANGCTVWFKKKLVGNIMIEYDAVVLENGGTNDRVSDLNCFWMATDPQSEDFFANSSQRNGKFQNYHNLQLYYVGLGGHDNTKTRFRRYAGGGDRPCLPEHDLSDEKYLITPNRTNSIRIIVYNGHILYYRNKQLIYDFIDQTPYTEGYFGIRTYKNHMTVDNFKVYRITKRHE